LSQRPGPVLPLRDERVALVPHLDAGARQGIARRLRVLDEEVEHAASLTRVSTHPLDVDPRRARRPTELRELAGPVLKYHRQVLHLLSPSRASTVSFSLCSDASQPFLMSREAIGAASLPMPLKSTLSTT